MAKDKYQVSLKCFLRDSSGRVLCLRAKADKHGEGYYDFPGGRIETDEFGVPLSDILAREIREELGGIDFEVDMKPALILRAAIGPAQETRILYVVYEGRYLGGDIVTSDEHENGVIWENPAEIDFDRTIAPPYREDIRRYFSGAPSVFRPKI